MQETGAEEITRCPLIIKQKALPGQEIQETDN